MMEEQLNKTINLEQREQFLKEINRERDEIMEGKTSFL